jgi:hypothetical protein
VRIDANLRVGRARPSRFSGIFHLSAIVLFAALSFMVSARPAVAALSSVPEAGTAQVAGQVEIFEGTIAKGTTQTDASGTWSKVLSGVADGTHAYTTKATDAAGNTSTLSNPCTLTVDASPPETTIDSGPSGVVNTSSVTFAFSSSEAGAAFECSLDGAAFRSCASPKAYTDLSNGSHTFRVRATDAANNIDPTPATRTWKIRVK